MLLFVIITKDYEIPTKLRVDLAGYHHLKSNFTRLCFDGKLLAFTNRNKKL
jgi:hypothetical protein